MGSVNKTANETWTEYFNQKNIIIGCWGYWFAVPGAPRCAHCARCDRCDPSRFLCGFHQSSMLPVQRLCAEFITKSLCQSFSLVLANRIQFLVEHDLPMAERAVVELSQATKVSRCDVETYFQLVWKLIDLVKTAPKETRDDVLLARHLKTAFLNLDQMHDGKVSMARNRTQLSEWASFNSSIVKMLWSYFIRLCARSTWSHSLAIMRLKEHWFSNDGPSMGSGGLGLILCVCFA